MNLGNKPKISLHKTPELISSQIRIPGSKSETNRALILNKLAGERVSINNLSDARDSRIMKALLSSQEKVLDVLDAGTTMRFLTAFFSATNQHKVLTGTERMKQRPISPLVDALRSIGANISYMEDEGFPPLEIKGFDSQKTDRIQIRGDISSQYISALLMIAPVLPNGLLIKLEGEVSSKPYIQMTLGIMRQFGLGFNWEGDTIHINHQEFNPSNINIEPDWSGAGYWYSFVAIAKKATLTIPGLKKDSLQGDSIIRELAGPLGVSTEFTAEGVLLRKISHNDQIDLDFSHWPDMAQTIAVICAAKNIQGRFTGLRSLRIKETDRIAALQNELKKINAQLIQEGDDDYVLIPSKNIPETAVIQTYEDHRMAMSFAPLCTMMDLEIIDPNVVDKSYPSFWHQVEKAGINTVINENEALI